MTPPGLGPTAIGGLGFFGRRQPFPSQMLPVGQPGLVFTHIPIDASYLYPLGQEGTPDGMGPPEGYLHTPRFASQIIPGWQPGLVLVHEDPFHWYPWGQETVGCWFSTT